MENILKALDEAIGVKNWEIKNLENKVAELKKDLDKLEKENIELEKKVGELLNEKV